MDVNVTDTTVRGDGGVLVVDNGDDVCVGTARDLGSMVSMM
ncbi:putative basic proline-rich protein-like [Iris pallida]|uniref:Basic proline-rich protein-like n=1 Tax=Iris pallida TaxID=29817 RepID=A0AAX6GAB3_IRIPA|nr:putative basic proline-rich protein-like [Iris pallida]